MERVLERLERIYRIGGGRGANRVGGTPGEQEAHDLAAGWMRDAGLEVEVDGAGNLVGRLRGAEPAAPEVWTGSHLDSVPEGGKFDGPLGVVAGLEAVERLGPQRRTLGVVAFRDEERGCVGSRARVASGPLPGAFVEAHVEQGPSSSAAGRRSESRPRSSATSAARPRWSGVPRTRAPRPWTSATDALCRAAELVLGIRDAANAVDGAVATVGRLEVEPGGVNVVPGKVTFTIDARAPDAERLDALVAALPVQVELQRSEPVALDTALMGDVLRQLDLPVVELPSGAGHDAGVLARAGVDLGDALRAQPERRRQPLAGRADERRGRRAVRAGGLERARPAGGVIEDLVVGGRVLARLPGFLRARLTLDEARAIVRDRLAHREERFLSFMDSAVLGQPSSPYRRLLAEAGCERGDLAALVRSEGVEGALGALRRDGVYLSVDEFKQRAPVVRGSTRFDVDPAGLVNPRSVVHGVSESSGSRGPRTAVPIDLAFIRDHAVNTILGLDAHGGAQWTHAHYGVPGGTAVTNPLELAVAGTPPARWFTPVDPAAPGLHRRYRLGSVALRVGARLGGSRLPPPVVAPLDDPLPVARWMSDVLAGGRVPHVWTFASSAVATARSAAEHGIDLTGARFTGGGEPTTGPRLASVRAAGAVLIPRYGTTETDILAYGCPHAVEPDDQHLFHDRHAVVVVERPVPGALLVTSLLSTAPIVLLNVSLGDRAELGARSCGCALEELGWHTHIHTVRSFEKLTAGGITFIDTDVVRVLEDVLPGAVRRLADRLPAGRERGCRRPTAHPADRPPAGRGARRQRGRRRLPRRPWRRLGGRAPDGAPVARGRPAAGRAHPAGDDRLGQGAARLTRPLATREFGELREAGPDTSSSVPPWRDVNRDRPSERTDAELLRQSTDGAAFAELYRRHVASVYVWCYRRLEWAASDLTAETFAQAWLSRKRFRDERDARRSPGCSGSPATSHASRPAATGSRRGRVKGSVFPSTSPPTTIHRRRRAPLPRLALAAAVDGLPEHERRALELRVVDELPIPARRAPRHPPGRCAPARVARASPTRRRDPQGGTVSTLPSSLVRFERQLGDAIDRRRSRHRRGLVLRATAVAAAAAAVALGLLSALPGNDVVPARSLRPRPARLPCSAHPTARSSTRSCSRR